METNPHRGASLNDCLAELMQTSRAQVDRMLQAKGNVTAETLQRAAPLVGQRLMLELV